MDMIQVEEFRGASRAFKAAGKLGKSSKSFGKTAFKSGRKVGKRAIKIGKKGAKKGAKLAKSPAGKKALKYGAAAAALGGGALYMNKKLKDKSEAVQGCVKVCLPEGYDEVVYGGKPKSSLAYRTIESVRAKGVDVDADQPFCSADVPECGDFCTSKCEELNPLDVPGGELVKAGAGAVSGALKNVSSFAAKGIWSAIKLPVYIGCGLCLCAILIYFFMMMSKKPRAGMAAPPPSRYY
jgi:hypothetical protein